MTPDEVAAILTTVGLHYEDVDPLVEPRLGFCLMAGIAPERVTVGVTVSLENDGTWTYDRLAKAAAALGTSNINFQWYGGCGDHSEVTPGDPAWFKVLIRW